jgi:hypothetical protein
VSEAEKQDIKGGGKKKRESICSVFSRTHPNALVYCDFHNYKSILISLYHLNLKLIRNFELRRSICKFRVSSHHLQIVGQVPGYPSTPKALSAVQFRRS